jgi:acetyl-CoA acetyltransferase
MVVPELQSSIPKSLTNMASNPAIPIIIGVADIKNASLSSSDAHEPAELMLRAINAALADTGTNIQLVKSNVDSIDCVATWTWPYVDLPGLLASKLGVNPKHKYIPDSHGGNQPAKLIDEAARRIAKGEARVAIVTGGEALASLGAYVKEQEHPPPHWTPPSTAVSSPLALSRQKQSRQSASQDEQKTEAIKMPGSWVDPNSSELGTRHAIGLPIQVYPLYENALRAHTGQSISGNNAESASLYASSAAVAARHPYAWSSGRGRAQEPQTAAEIGMVSPQNRMICWPYPLLMNAFNTVNLAAAVVLTSTDVARELGVPEERWIYPLGGAGTSEHADFWRRPGFHESLAIGEAVDKALGVSGLRKEEVDVWDFYSCFPVVPKLACRHVGLDVLRPEKPITVLGGLTSFGGAGNNYSMHAITEMTRLLRQLRKSREAGKGGGGRHANGVVLANGGVVTYQHALVLSSSAPLRRYPAQNPLPRELTYLAGSVPEIVDRLPTQPAQAVVETYTVEFSRDGKPEKGFVVGRLVDGGKRFLANTADEKTAQDMVRGGLEEAEEMVGRKGWAWGADDGRNLWAFEKPAEVAKAKVQSQQVKDVKGGRWRARFGSNL